MDYEEKYKEALELARDYYKANLKLNKADENLILEDIFSELRESKDERIREEIEQLIQCMHDADPRKKRWIAWLEKQKEYESTDFEYVWDRTDCGALTSALDKYSKEAIINMCHAWYDKGIELERKSWLEKQGEQKEYTFKSIPRLLDMIEPSDRAKAYCQKLIDSLLKEGYTTDAKIISDCLKQMNGEKVAMAVMDIEKQDEQKTDNKPELKFAVNDWVVNKYGDIWHIDSLDKKNYQVSNNGKYNYFPIVKQDEMHLWTIEDAKPGDLLFISTKQRNYWAMFKEYDDNNKFIFFYCYICGNFNIGGFVPIDCINKINPLPFSPHSGRFYNTMKKAGYEWDAEKKELKKLSQRMISSEAKEALYDKPTDEEMKELLRTEYEKGRADTIAEMYVPTQISPEESLGVSSEKYMDIVDTFTQGGQKPAKWSLEDERVIAIINNALTESNTPPDDYDKVYDWLESLKQRIKSYE